MGVIVKCKFGILACFAALLFLVGAYYAESVDGMTRAKTMIDYAHHEVHSGSSFGVGYSVTTGADDDHRSSIGFTTPNTTKWLHLVATISASHAAEFFLREAPTIDDDDGTQAVAYNRNRNSATASTVLSLEGTETVGSVTTFDEAELVAATFSGGTVLEYVLMQAGGGPKAVGGVSRGSQEWILDQNAKYVFTIQNIGANANTHVIHLDWYEHQNKN